MKKTIISALAIGALFFTFSCEEKKATSDDSQAKADSVA